MSSPSANAVSPATAPTWRRKSVREMNSAERLASLREWAEEKKYVQPGEGGTFNVNGIGGIQSLVFGGPMQTGSHSNSNGDKYAGQYDAPVGPPTYRAATNEEPKERRKSKLGRWVEAYKEKKAAKRRESAPAYTP